MTSDAEAVGEAETSPAASPETLRRLIAAILASDVAGYSRLVAEDEEGTVRRLAEYSKIFREAIARNQGRVFNTAGDAILAEFPSAVCALRAGIEVQEALRPLNEPLPPGRRLEFRMGITVGDVIEQGTDLLGDGVNIAARLEGLAEPGGICVSRAVHEAAENKVPARFKDLGRQKLKNIAKPIQVYRVVPEARRRHEAALRRSLAAAALLALLGGGAGLLWAFRDSLPDWLSRETKTDPLASAAAHPRPPLTVSVVRPVRRCFPDAARVTGYLVPRREVEVRPDSDGVRIVDVSVQPLAQVQAGQQLATVMPAANRSGLSTPLRSPVAGVVGKVSAVKNGLAGTQGPALFTIIADGEMELSADAPAAVLDRLAVNQNVSVRPIGLPQIPGRVRTISPAVDPATQLGHVRIALNRTPDQPWGVFARGTITIGQRCGLALPPAAVLYEPEGQAVYVATNDFVEARPVTTGLSSDREVEIRSGLRDTDMVIQRAGPFLREGDPVAPVEAGAR